MILLRHRLLCCAACTVLVGLGCSGSANLHPVSGVVTLEGKPLANTRVTFNPTDSAGRMAFGQTDSEGQFKLTTFNHNDGALPGQYKVTISVVGPAHMVDSALATNLKGLLADRERNLKNKPPQVHANYLTPAKTPLQQDVPTSGEVKIDLRNDGT